MKSFNTIPSSDSNFYSMWKLRSDYQFCITLFGKEQLSHFYIWGVKNVILYWKTRALFSNVMKTVQKRRQSMEERSKCRKVFLLGSLWCESVRVSQWETECETKRQRPLNRQFTYHMSIMDQAEARPGD